MANPSARLLELLVLLQSRTSWTAPQLAARLEISERTVRYDVTKLRALGYPVRSVSGIAGGYRLEAGASMPPVLLDEQEAVEVVLALRSATAMSGAGGEAAATALVKIEQVLPHRVRPRLAALRSFTESAVTDAPVDTDLVVRLTSCCRDGRRIRFAYTKQSGESSKRDVEPHRVVRIGPRWYLVAYDVDRGHWRTFRLDRLALVGTDGPRFASRPAPRAQDVVRQIDRLYALCTATVAVPVAASAMDARLPAGVVVETVDAGNCLVHATGRSPEDLVLNLVMLGEEFVLVDGDSGVAEAVRRVVGRLERAVRGWVV